MSKHKIITINIPHINDNVTHDYMSYKKNNSPSLFANYLLHNLCDFILQIYKILFKIKPAFAIDIIKFIMDTITSREKSVSENINRFVYAANTEKDDIVTENYDDRYDDDNESIGSIHDDNYESDDDFETMQDLDMEGFEDNTEGNEFY